MREREMSMSASQQQQQQSWWAVSLSVVGQAAVVQAWEHGDGRGGTATQLARSATPGRTSVGSPVS